MTDEVLVYDCEAGIWRSIPAGDVPAWKGLCTIKKMISSDQPLDLDCFEALVSLVAQSSLHAELTESLEGVDTASLPVHH